ncbi:MAG: peptide-methionine (S)-S-oxide reductase MsrA [Lysobacteraceae bacterium]
MLIPESSRHSRPTRLYAFILMLPLLAILVACSASNSGSANAAVPAAQATASSQAADASVAATAPAQQTSPTSKPSGESAIAVFAGGCFWCMQPPFDKVPGVISTEAGYAGGKQLNPTYEQVSAGGTGHAEAVQVTYDPNKVSYHKLLDVFWHNIDPIAVNRQFCDSGDQYRSAIFPIGDEQRREAEASKRAIEADPRFKQPIATRIEPTAVFYPAEDYHQEYYKKNPVRYKYYRYGCGRDQRLNEIWGNHD